MSKPHNPPLFDGAYGKDDTPTYSAAITLLDLFAAIAMQALVDGVLSDGNASVEARTACIFTSVPAGAYKLADAMLAERARRELESDDG